MVRTMSESMMRRVAGRCGAHRLQGMATGHDERRDDPGVPIAERQPLTFTGIFLGHVTEEDYRHNERGERGTRTATLSKDGLSS